MKRIILLILISTQIFALSNREVTSLLEKTGYTEKHYEKFQNYTYNEVVTKILDESDSERVISYPKWRGKSPVSQIKGNGKELLLKNEMKRVREKELKNWWVKEVKTADTPLVERMTIFWHNYLGSKLSVPEEPVFMLEQNIIFREHAMGNFSDIVKKIVYNPTMLKSYSLSTSVDMDRERSLSKELLEIFVLDEKSTRDGQVNELKVGKLSNNQFRDNLGPEEIMEILMKNPETSETIVSNLYYEFIKREISKKERKRLAKLLRDKNYEIKPVIKEIFLSKEFRDPNLQSKTSFETLFGSVKNFSVDFQGGASKFIKKGENEI